MKAELEYRFNHMKEKEWDEKDANHITHIETENTQSQKKRILSEVFFACENCNGPLIQQSFCRICKKTDLRICLKCKHVKTFGDHGNCLRIIMLDTKKIFSKDEN